MEIIDVLKEIFEAKKQLKAAEAILETLLEKLLIEATEEK